MTFLIWWRTWKELADSIARDYGLPTWAAYVVLWLALLAFGLVLEQLFIFLGIQEG